MTDDKIKVLKETQLFKELDDAVIGVLAERSIVKRLKRNEILFVEGEPAKGLFVVASGAIRAFRTAADGREQVIHVERAITTIAEVPVFDEGNYPSTTAADEPSTVYFLDKKLILNTALQHPDLALAAVRLLASRLRRCAELVETLSLHEVGQRLARFLLHEAATDGVKTSHGTRVTLRLTHNQLAARIGTVREVVTRTLIRLQDQKMIVHKGKSILVPDMRALASYAEAGSAR
ncbi:MAG: Crp/Fnr family transcriptional regulator [Pyrinomonadaceae bacterium]